MRPIVASAVAVTLVIAGSMTTLAASHTSSGKLRFGEGIKNGHLINVTSDIPKGKNVAWLVHVTKIPASALRLEITQIQGPGPHPQLLHTWKVKESKPFSTLTAMLTVKQLKAMKLPASKFRMDYLKGNSVVATGTWTLLSCSANCGPGGGGGY